MGNSRTLKMEREYSVETLFVFHGFFFLSPCWEMGKWVSNKSFCVFGSFLIAHCKLIYIHSNFFYAVHVRQPQFEFWFCCCDSAQSASTSFSRVVTRFEIFLTEKSNISIFYYFIPLVEFPTCGEQREEIHIFSNEKRQKSSIGTHVVHNSLRPRTCALVPKLAFLCCCFVVAGSLGCQLFFRLRVVSFLCLAHFSCHKSDEQNDAYLLQRTQELRWVCSIIQCSFVDVVLIVSLSFSTTICYRSTSQGCGHGERASPKQDSHYCRTFRWGEESTSSGQD